MIDNVRLLVERARDGDSEAVAGLFERYRGRVIRFCLTFLRVDEADALDITQEVFVRVFSSIAGLEDPGKFESWLFSIARRRCLTFIAGRAKRRDGCRRLAQEGTDGWPGGEKQEQMQAMERKIVSEEIERLDDSPLKDCGRMFYVEGRDTGSIAENMDVPVSTVTTWLSRFRSKVRKRLIVRILALREHGGYQP